MLEPEAARSAWEIVADEIDRNGPLSFGRYMALALYHPTHGFYSAGGAGRRRDFITSPEVGPLFGAVVARAIDGWWDELGRPESFAFVDAGAGPGTLARAIRKAEPRCLSALHYVAVETSAAQRAHHPEGVISTASMPTHLGPAVVVANELLDNLPFDLFEFDAELGWREIRIGMSRGVLTEEPGPLGEDDLRRLTEPPDGRRVRVPIQREAEAWLRAALDLPQVGRVVVIDYAVGSYPVADDHQWLRTYDAHERGHDPLRAPGQEDITADVDLSALQAVRPASEQSTQAAWLRSHGIDELVQEGRDRWRAHAAAPDLEAMTMRSRVNEAEALLDPEGLGRFVVLEWAIGPSETSVTR